MAPNFTEQTKVLVGKRAAFRCSNPDCDKPTVGPNSDPLLSVSIGEVAHIYGAQPGSARFRDEMVDAERSSPMNAIWLCRDCHGHIDRDLGRFPAELLFRWKERHERKVLAQLGKPGDIARAEVEDEELADLQRLPGFIRQLARERPDFWEYLLTAELLTHYLAPILRRARDLQSGAYALPAATVSDDDFVRRIGAWTDDLSHAVAALDRIVNVELKASWGPPGTPGIPADINHACQLYARAADRLVSIAEEVKFTRVGEGYAAVRDLVFAGAMYSVPRLVHLPEFLRGVFSREDPTGTHEFELVIELPPGWADDIGRAMRRATRTGWW